MKFAAIIILSGMLLTTVGCASGSLSIDTDAFTGNDETSSNKRIEMLEDKIDQLEDKVESREKRVKELE